FDQVLSASAVKPTRNRKVEESLAFIGSPGERYEFPDGSGLTWEELPSAGSSRNQGGVHADAAPSMAAEFYDQVRGRIPSELLIERPFGKTGARTLSVRPVEPEDEVTEREDLFRDAHLDDPHRYIPGPSDPHYDDYLDHPD